MSMLFVYHKAAERGVWPPSTEERLWMLGDGTGEVSCHDRLLGLPNSIYREATPNICYRVLIPSVRADITYLIKFTGRAL
jgi:hypothetical protein